ncbi:hypothetical protein DHEL01_v208054 [Diaporthe helianthi]|uniref:2EXR domain-containing protein n=1 Tax=Diaporthe helianthi TaxID=158607 RepID=A0A2P5HTG9_DIAHE|nr:hypothetical protein DHEL01_v208054 [Diaporthe helianthi]
MSSLQPADFPRFLELPFEIRWQIYELCLPIRVIDGEIRELELPMRSFVTKEDITALKYIVARFSRTPVVARAIPEVYRKLQRDLARPPDGEWVWGWIRYDVEAFTDSRPVIFDQRSDILYISPIDWSRGQNSQNFLDGRSPFYLVRNKNATLAIDEVGIFSGLTWPRLLKQCLLDRKKCIIILNETTIVKPAEWITSCGLFGLFGEERTVLVDVDDLTRIDYFDGKLNGQGMTDAKPLLGEMPITPGGIRRYSSHSNFDIQATWQHDSPLVSAETRAEIIERDKKEMTRRIQLYWLIANDSPGVSLNGAIWDGKYDEKNPKVKFWLDKLPTFTFAVRVYAQDLEECARLTSAREARRRIWRQQVMVW